MVVLDPEDRPIVGADVAAKNRGKKYVIRAEKVNPEPRRFPASLGP
jgi:hypothetical protein